MAAASWVCLLLPLASAVVITAGGTAIPRRITGYVSTLTTIGAFVAAIVASFNTAPGNKPNHNIPAMQATNAN